MAIRPEDLLVNFLAANANYPEGSFVDSTTPSATDGSELVKDWTNDIFGFLQKLIDNAGITPNGAPDTVPVSDYFKSLSNLIVDGNHGVDTGVADAYVVEIGLTPVNTSTALVLKEGGVYSFKATNANTGGSTLNVNSLGVTPLKRPDGSDLQLNDIPLNAIVRAMYDGTNFIFLNFNTIIKTKASVSTRDTALASSAQAITGVGFKPKAIIVFSVESGTSEASWGFGDDNGEAGMYDNNNVSGGSYTGGVFIRLQQGVGIDYSGVLQSLDADGFTVDWTKTGATTGIVSINYMAIG